MRIALAHPTYPPERSDPLRLRLASLGRALARGGHEVTVLTTHRRRREVIREDGVEVERRWRPPDSLTERRAYEAHLPGVPGLAWAVRRGRYDIVHAFGHVPAWAALQARSGAPVVYTCHDVPTREFMVERRYRLELLLAVIRGAASVTVTSEQEADAFCRYLLRPPALVVLDDADEAAAAFGAIYEAVRA